LCGCCCVANRTGICSEDFMGEIIKFSELSVKELSEEINLGFIANPKGGFSVVLLRNEDKFEISNENLNLTNLIIYKKEKNEQNR
jgi:hypothetical protein